MNNQKELVDVNKKFARFIIDFGTHKAWCKVVIELGDCNCGYETLFDAAHEFLKEIKNANE